MTDDEELVLAANAAFYAAFEAQDIGAMAGVWDRSERARCTHPGWARLEGWDTIEESWRRIFAGPQTLQFILTEVDVTVAGDAAWVVLDENLLGGAAATVSTVNIFVRRARSTWNLVNHHGSSVIG